MSFEKGAEDKSSNRGRNINPRREYNKALRAPLTPRIAELVSQLQVKTYQDSSETYQDVDASLEMLAEIVGALGIGLVFLDKACRMGFANERVRQLLKSDEHLTVRGTHLAIRDRADDLRLEQLVRGMVAGRGAGAASSKFMRLQAGSGSVTILRFMLVPSAATDDEGKLIALIHQMHEPVAPSDERLQAVFDLTPSEAVVARQLTLGKSLDEVAAKTGASVGTIRVHLRSIFRKTNTNRQGELVSLLAESSKILFG